MYRNPNLPKVEDMIHRRVYKIHCRNLAYGVWNKESGGFIGIREKFGDRFLFTELHYDVSEAFGTVGMAIDTGITVPEEIPMKEYLGSIDQTSERPVAFKQIPGKNTGIWYFTDTGSECSKIRPCAVMNKELFQFLVEIENERRSSDLE